MKAAEHGVSHSSATSPDELAAVNAAAMQYFTKYNRRKVAVDYLSGRGINPPNNYPVGYAPVGGGLSDFLQQRGFCHDVQVIAGVVRRVSTDRVYDVFRNRVVVPVHVRNRIAGFVGRSLDTRSFGPRYLNTAATGLFDKGRLLYGLDERRQDLAAGATPVLVEGFTDVLAIAQHVVGVVPVAALGTAFTVPHAELLNVVVPVKRLIEALDPDAAGRASAMKAAEILIPRGWQMRTPRMLPGADPASLAHRYGPRIAQWLEPRRCRPTLHDIVEYRIQIAGPLDWAEQRVAAYHRTRDYLRDRFPRSVELESATNLAAELTGITRRPQKKTESAGA